ncbi:MAG: VPLPA-CTERM sorting domain-containing protein [Litoreibacter sp.]|nr:VPLPA-CTERM sorting domain-containing protein [Litoreibacter sp.]
MRFLATLALAASLPFAVQAAVVQEGSTQVGDTNNILGVRGTSIASDNPAYDPTPTGIASDWVWLGDINDNDFASFEMTFDLTGFDVSTASLFGFWGVDNAGVITLNGTQIAELSGLSELNFAALSPYGTFDSSLFLAGENSLRFELQDLGGPAAFRATARVTAEPLSAVPLPAGAPLLLAGIAGLALLRSRRQR